MTDERDEHRRSPWPVLVAISAGGVVGALGRYGLQRLMPPEPGQFAWATFVTNVSGCLLIGVLLVLVTEVWPGRRLAGPFLGVGVLGGYTTFSTYVGEAVTAASVRTALLYLIATLAGALVAVWAGTAGTAWLVKRGRAR